MSSITSQTRRRNAGQVLIIFAFGLVGIVAIAALVFDAGQDLVERRQQQKAADAAALAGAKYLSAAGCKGVNTTAGCPDSVALARELASANGYVTGADVTVTVKIPPGPESKFAGMPSHIEVMIDKTRPSTFSGILGLSERRVTTIAVASNIDDFSISASLLALDPSACGSGQFGGNGVITTTGGIQVNSTCLSDALHGAGANVVLHAPSCSVVGGYQGNSKSDVNCSYPSSPSTLPATGSSAMPDPLANLGAPSIAAVGTPRKVDVRTGETPHMSNCPDGLPLSTTQAGTQANPQTCSITSGVTHYHFYPGVYWGGIKINGSNTNPPTIYLDPGI